MTNLPWWASVVLAAIAYIGLRYIAPFFLSGTPAGLAIAKVLPVAAPWFALLFLLPAPFAYLKTRRRRRLLDLQRNLSTIRSLKWHEFELMIGEAYRRQGYAVEERGGPSPDGGVDLVLRKNGERTIVQCKHWKYRQVGVAFIRELLGVVVAAKADRGILVTSGAFTSEAIEFARNNSIELVDGKALDRLVSKPGKDKKADVAMARMEPTLGAVQCPNCGAEMVRRTAKRGPNAGGLFWGCSRYPGCNGIRPI